MMEETHGHNPLQEIHKPMPNGPTHPDLFHGLDRSLEPHGGPLLVFSLSFLFLCYLLEFFGFVGYLL
jgi:hypothetical protein